MKQYYYSIEENYADPESRPRLFYLDKDNKWIGLYTDYRDETIHFVLTEAAGWDSHSIELFKPATIEQMKIYPDIMEELKQKFYQDVLTS